MRPRPLLLLALLLWGSRAGAAPAERRGPLFGVRIGWSVPYGDVADAGPPLADLVERLFPISLDLGYRFNRRIWGQLFLAGAPGTAAQELCGGVRDCSATGARVGLAFQLRLATRARLEPWIGLGIGIEALLVEGTDPASGISNEWSWGGLEIPAEVGLDVAVGDRLAIGPYVSVSLAQFTSEWVRPSGGSTTSGSVKDRANHGWITGGMKVTLRL